jgi:hypothetical protein
VLASLGSHKTASPERLHYFSQITGGNVSGFGDLIRGLWLASRGRQPNDRAESIFGGLGKQ